MRYIYQEPIITTVQDDEITDDTQVRALFQKLQSQLSNVSMTLEDPEQPDYMKNYDQVRITKVNDDSIDIHCFFGGASARYRGIPFVRIRKVRLIADRSLMGKNHKVTRFHQMDVAEIE